MIRVGSAGLALESDPELLWHALALAAASGRGLEWSGYRSKGARPGFDAFEAQGAAAFAALVGGELSGGGEGDTRLGFSPAAFSQAPPGGAPRSAALSPRGSMLRWLRAALLPLSVAGREGTLRVTGSTHGSSGETFEVTASTWCHLLRTLGVELTLTLEYAGFVPRGKGEVSVRVGGVPPAAWQGADWTGREPLSSVQIVSAGAAIPENVQQRQAARARSGVHIAGMSPHVQLLKLAARGAGSVVAVTGLFGDLPVTFSALKERGKSAEWVGESAAVSFRRYAHQSAVVPGPLVPSCLLYLAFTPAGSVLTTPELVPSAERTAALIEAFTGRAVLIDGTISGPARIEVPPPSRTG